MKKILILIICLVLCFLLFVFFNQNDIEKFIKKGDERLNSTTKEVSNDLFSKYYDKAFDVVNQMSLEEKVGQLFLVRYDSNLASNEIKNNYPGGYIFFAKDFEGEDKVSFKNKINYYQSISKIPLVVAVDEEGGYVTRVSRFKNFRDEKFLSPREIYDQGGYQLLEKQEREKAQLLLSIGINLNLAPVSDVSIDSNDYIYNRSFGYDAKETSIFVKNMVNYANSSGISSCLKHFPGYGNNVDTHTGVAIDNRSYDNFLQSDFLPFESGIDEGVPAILFSHNIVNSIDSNYPASLSLKMHKLLRDKLKFSGIIITDDLAMDAVKSYVDDGNAATLAVNSLNDLIITSDFSNMYNEVLNSIKNNDVDISIVDRAVRRIIAYKYQYGILK